MRKPLPLAFGQFLFAGAIGFAVDAAVVTLMMHVAGWPPLAARITSFSVAVTVTWILNRRYAFAGRGSHTVVGEYVAYVAIQLVGATLNIGIFILCMNRWPTLVRWPVVPLAAGSAVALAFNFTLARALVFRRGRHRGASLDAG